MKIAFLNIYQDGILRGAETYVAELSKRLGKNHKVDVLTQKRDTVYAKTPLIWRAFLDRESLVILCFTLKNIGKIFMEKYDIVVPLNGGWQVALIRLVTWFYGGKMVISAQAGFGWDDRNNLWSFPDCFVCLTEYGKKWAMKANPFVRLMVIPNGVDFNRFSNEKRKFFIELGRPLILTVAALEKGKRIDLLIKAVSKIKDASLLIAGDGPEKDNITNICTKYLHGRFMIKKFSRDDMPRVYKSADLFVSTSSEYYAFEIAIVEAMASGTNIIVNDDPIRREIVRDCAYLVDVTDTDALATVIKKALKSKGLTSCRNIAKTYDWDNITLLYESLFNSLCQN